VNLNGCLHIETVCLPEEKAVLQGKKQELNSGREIRQSMPTLCRNVVNSADDSVAEFSRRQRETRRVCWQLDVKPDITQFISTVTQPQFCNAINKRLKCPKCGGYSNTGMTVRRSESSDVLRRLVSSIV